MICKIVGATALMFLKLPDKLIVYQTKKQHILNFIGSLLDSMAGGPSFGTYLMPTSAALWN
jgi:hypothetical protein